MPSLHRIVFTVPSSALLVAQRIQRSFLIWIAADNSCEVSLNGNVLFSDLAENFDFAYWNHLVRAPPSLLRAGQNMLAIVVNNTVGSSDKYLDAMIELNLTMSSFFSQWNFSYGQPATVSPIFCVFENILTVIVTVVKSGKLEYRSNGG